MIPKVIHYCWFGGNPLPDLAVKCIKSWKKYFPNYEIKEWNEKNFDLNCCDYVKEAYKTKKWAFVSDYARFWILYNYGGLYFDTDVEIIKSFDDILEKGAFMGCEPSGTNVVVGKNIGSGAYQSEQEQEKCAIGIGVNPGLGLGIPPRFDIYKEILDFYQTKHFIMSDGHINTTTIVKYTTDILLKHGWQADGHIQYIEGIYIYPSEYFCPIDYSTGEITITKNTHSIHHYTASWIQKSDMKYIHISQVLCRHFGHRNGTRIARMIDFPHRVKQKFRLLGWKNTLQFIVKKLKQR